MHLSYETAYYVEYPQLISYPTGICQRYICVYALSNVRYQLGTGLDCLPFRVIHHEEILLLARQGIRWVPA